MAKHFSDIRKDPSDLLINDFPADGTVKVNVQSKTADGLTMKATLNRGFKRDKTGIKEIVSAVFEPKFEWKKHNLEFSGKFSTQNDFSGGLSLKDLGSTGTKVDVTLSQTERDGPNAQVSASYKTDVVATKFGLTYPFPSGKKDNKPTKINGELVFQIYKFLVGTNITLDIEEKVSWKGEGQVNYTNSSYQVTARGSREQKSDQLLWGFSFFKNISPSTKLAIDLETDPAVLKPVASVAGECQLDDATTVKGKWSVKLTETSKQAELRAGLGLKQKVSPYFTAVLGADLNFRNLLGDIIGDPHSFGVEIKLSD